MVCRCSILISVLFSMWTILQSSFHLVFVIYAYFLSNCMKSPTTVNTIFFYLTYFYKKSCTPPTLKTFDLSINHFNSLENFFSLLIDAKPLNATSIDIVQGLLAKLDVFPEEANASKRTSTYFLIMIIADILWLTTAMALLMGIAFRVKYTSSLFFYAPWLLVTGLFGLLDVAISIQFGFDTIETMNFGNWMKFVGVPPKAFPEDWDQSAPYLWTMFPSISVCALGSRFVIIWLSNWVGFFLVLKIAMTIYHESEKITTTSNTINNNFPSNVQQFNSSAARIRNWQLFYGAIETTSTRSSKSPNSDSRNNSFSGSDVENETVGVHLGSSSPLPRSSGNYYAYSDVADNITDEIYELRGQLPWSYTGKHPLQKENETVINNNR